MNNEEFLEKLIRLTIDSGWGNESNKNCYVFKSRDCIEVSFERESNLKVIEDIATHLERIIFDHDFIKVLCGLSLTFQIRTDIKDYKGILAQLATSTDRTKFLMDTFGELIND